MSWNTITQIFKESTQSSVHTCNKKMLHGCKRKPLADWAIQQNYVIFFFTYIYREFLGLYIAHDFWMHKHLVSHAIFGRWNEPLYQWYSETYTQTSSPEISVYYHTISSVVCRVTECFSIDHHLPIIRNFNPAMFFQMNWIIVTVISGTQSVSILMKLSVWFLTPKSVFNPISNISSLSSSQHYYFSALMNFFFFLRK